MRSVCVFCGSRAGSEPGFAQSARDLGVALAARGLTLVYGGAKVGLMGVLADAALSAGGRVVGVIPRGLVAKEVAHDGLSELHLTETMHDRKNQMMALSDAFVALPGGFGTYDELFEVLTLAQIGFHQKPLGLLDDRGFFDPLLALLRHTIDRGFASATHAELVLVESESGTLLDRLASWAPPDLGNKWR